MGGLGVVRHVTYANTGVRGVCSGASAVWVVDVAIVEVANGRV